MGLRDACAAPGLWVFCDVLANDCVIGQALFDSQCQVSGRKLWPLIHILQIHVNGNGDPACLGAIQSCLVPSLNLKLHSTVLFIVQGLEHTTQPLRWWALNGVSRGNSLFRLTAKRDCNYCCYCAKRSVSKITVEQLSNMTLTEPIFFVHVVHMVSIYSLLLIWSSPDSL